MGISAFWPAGIYRNANQKTVPIKCRAYYGRSLLDQCQSRGAVGFVGIELPTRRSNRLNGVVNTSGDTLSVDVVQSYGNCPQYIHTRGVQFHRNPQIEISPKREGFTDIPTNVAAVIRASDTFFVTSHNHHDDPRDTGGVARGRPKTLDRDRVLQTALIHYWSKGPANVSISDICNLTGASKPGVYREFGSDDGLKKAVLEVYQGLAI